MKTGREQREELKVDDEVAVALHEWDTDDKTGDSYFTEKMYFTKITRVTKNQLSTETGHRFRKSDGRFVSGTISTRAVFNCWILTMKQLRVRNRFEREMMEAMGHEADIQI